MCLNVQPIVVRFLKFLEDNIYAQGTQSKIISPSRNLWINGFYRFKWQQTQTVMANDEIRNVMVVLATTKRLQRKLIVLYFMLNIAYCS